MLAAGRGGHRDPSRTRVQAGCGLPRCGREGIKKSAPAARSSNSQEGPKVADISLPADDPLLDSKGEDHGNQLTPRPEPIRVYL